MNYRLLSYVTAGLIGVSAIAGCATRGAVRNLEVKVKELREHAHQNANRIQDLALTPKAETCAYVSKATHPRDFKTLHGKLTEMYQDSESRKTAQELADLLRIDALGGRDAYNVSVLQDVNNDGVATKGVDYWIVNYRKNAQGVEEVVRLFRVPREMVPESVRNRLHAGCRIN